MSPKEVKTPDLRVRRTRLMISKAFVELLAEKEFHAITVQDITDRAMVNRATFYDHFTDKYALFEHSMRETFQRTLEGKIPADFSYCAGGLQYLIATVCEFVAQLDDHCRPHNPQGLPPTDEQITSLLSEFLVKWIEGANSEVQTESPTLMANIISWAMYGAAHHWAAQKDRQVLDDYSVRAAHMIAAIIQQSEFAFSSTSGA